MWMYIAKRIGQGLIVFLLVIWFTFSLPYMISPHGALTAAYEICAQHQTHSCIYGVASRYGLNTPYFPRLWHYIWNLFAHFNLGISLKDAPPQVTKLIALNIPRTIWLAMVSLLLSIIISIPVGIAQAWRRNRGFDYTMTATLFILYATPAFVLCFLLLDAFAIHHAFGISFPNSPPSGVHPWAMFTNPKGFVLPIVALTLLSIAGLSRFMRSSVIDTLVQDFIRTAKAKGCSPRRILFRHALRPALTPIITIIGLSIPGLLSGALIIEEVFNYPGLGYVTVSASQNLDTDLVLGITVMITMLTIVGNLVADLVLALVDPRIRMGAKS
jgi:peptide/nickel transport system permease protein